MHSKPRKPTKKKKKYQKRNPTTITNKEGLLKNKNETFFFSKSAFFTVEVCFFKKKHALVFVKFTIGKNRVAS